MSENNNLVTVIIPFYNLGEYLDAAVNSVIAQTYTNWELFIINDGSTDETSIAKVREYDHHPDSRVKVFHNENQGLAKTRNFGIERANGKYICCLDADDIYREDFLTECVAVLDQDDENKLGFVVTHWELFGYENGIWRFEKPSEIDFLVDNYCPVAGLFRKEAWEKVGGYDLVMRGYQDWNFWISIIRHGYDYGFVEKPLFKYNRRKGSMLSESITRDKELYKMIISNNKELYLKHLEDVLADLRSSRDQARSQRSDWEKSYKKLQRQHLEVKHDAYNKTKLLDRYQKNELVELEAIKNSAIWQYRTALRGKGLSLKSRLKLLLRPIYQKLPFIRTVFNSIRYKHSDQYENFTNQVWNGPLVSVVIPVYNYGNYIDECVESVFAQGLEDRVEIIIVEGFSTDGTREILLEREKSKKWRGVKFIFQDSRKSIGENRLAGIQAATGKYVSTLDADDKYGPGYLKACLEALESGNYDVAYTDIKEFGDSERYLPAGGFNPVRMFEHNYINPPALFKKSFWEEHNVGYSDHRDIFEDWDFWMRMTKAGARFIYVPRVYNLYRIHTAQGESMTDMRLNRQAELEYATWEPYKDYDKAEWFQNTLRNNEIKYIVTDPRINLDWEKEPFITIVTPVYNGGKFIEGLIENLANQTYRNFEHIVIDGASKDNTVEILEKYKDRLTYISEPDKGQTDAINKGFRMAKGEIITWLCADDYYATNDVLQQVRDYFQNPETNIIVGKAIVVDNINKTEYEAPRQEVNEEGLIRWWNYYSIPTQPAIFHRRKLLAEVGELDTSLHYTMDHDLWLKFAARGYKFTQVPEIFAVMLVHEESKTGSQQNKFLIEHEKVAKRYWGNLYEPKYWRRKLQHFYIKNFKYPERFAK